MLARVRGAAGGIPPSSQRSSNLRVWRAREGQCQVGSLTGAVAS